MSEKKNIDRLFQEKFKDFEAAPPEFVWDNIREALEEKKKKRVIPIWIRLSGVAALLIIGLLAGLQIMSGINPNDNPVVIQSPVAQPNQPLQITPSKNPIPNGDSISDSTNSINTNPVNSALVTTDGNALENSGTGNTGTPSSKNTIQNSTNPTGSSSATATNPSAFRNKNNTVAGGSNRNGGNASNKNNGANKNAKASKYLTNPATGVAENASGSNNNKGNNATNGIIKQGGITNTTSAVADAGTASQSKSGTNRQGGSSNSTSAVADNSKSQSETNSTGNVPQNNNNTANTGIAATNTTGNNSNNVNNSTVTPQQNAIDKTIPLNEQAVAETPVDTTAAAPENELEKLLQEKLNGEKENKGTDLAEGNTSKWKVKPQVAPVFYSSMSQGSPIDGQFANNSKSYENDLSYGLGVNYAVNKRLSIRSGVNTLNLNYATQGVEFYASLNGATNNINARNSNATIVVQNQNSKPGGNTASSPIALFADQLPQETFNGSMVQSTGYVEVPVELSYALLNKKFGIDIIGGVSTLFLNDNNVSVISNQGLTTSVGEAQNLNNVHFSTNVGIGFKYKFFKAFEANFEPMFKYQVNTYSRDNGNFKPYFIGLYSGISFSF
ncbi:hypothetical protein [Flavobacterium subsaxonicum]|uniref:hypothetical protein n=1 Tax=Flavobacterium subsaxonicum TaxID=426226 RepID=UPI0004145100|nr:hypothetical protein [Flavobacterium subsaxonicum]